MKKAFSLCLVLIMLVSSIPGFAFGEDGEEVYEWTNLKIGGEGFVTGIVFHPKEKDLFYTRTDVGGAYRWNPTTESWISLGDTFAYSDASFLGTDGLAVDPNNPDVVYIAAGGATWSKGDVLKSTDRGDTWTPTGLNKPFDGNGSNRGMGECIMVDPNNSSIIYVGTAKDGLYMSEDGALSWKPVEGINNQGNNIRNIVFDPRNVSGGKTQTIYVGVLNQGLYRSDNAGASWTLVEGSPASIKRMDIKNNGGLLVASNTGLFLYENNTWTEISPAGYEGLVYNGIDVDPNNNDYMVCLGPHTSKDNDSMRIPMWTSMDGGKTWSNRMKVSTKYTSQPWKSAEAYSAGAGTANGHCIAMNPFNTKEVWTTDFASAYRTKDINANEVVWEMMYDGVEEIVPRFGISPPDGKYRFIAAIADIDGLPFDNILEYPTRQLRVDRAEVYNHPWMMSSADMDYCREDSNIILKVGIDWNADGKMEFSTDNSESWTFIENTPYYVDEQGNQTTRIPFGRCAVSSTKHPETGKAVFVVIPCYNPNDTNKRLPEGMNTVPIVSMDYGETWVEAKGLPEGMNIMNDYWQKFKPIVADTVKGNIFYMLINQEVYISEDWGLNWTKTGAKIGGDPNTGLIYNPPGIEGEVWISMNGGTGIYRSKDYGKTFNQLSGISDVVGFGFGKEAPGKTFPTLYLYGKVNGTEGMFRSIDEGATFVKINDDVTKLGAVERFILGDSRTFGIVYVGTAGRGYYLGLPAGMREQLEAEAAGSTSVRIGEPEVYYNKQILNFINKPVEQDGKFFVPIREFMKYLDVLDLSWDSATDSLVIKRKEIDVQMGGTSASGNEVERTIQLKLGDAAMTVNGESVAMSAAPHLITDNMYVPLDDIVKALGATMEYDENQKQYKITDNALVTY